MNGYIPRTPEEILTGELRPTPEQEAEAEKVRQEKLELRRRFLIVLMENPMFREMLREWHANFQTFGNVHAAGPAGVPDPMATQFYLGRKSAGWDLFLMFDDVAPDLSSLMRRGQ